MLLLLLLLPVLLVLPRAAPKEILNLGDLSWRVVNSAGDMNVKGRVPGGIYTDLHVAGYLRQDISYGFNDQEYRWVGYDNWTYYTTFNVEKDCSDLSCLGGELNLVFYGVDTIAEVTLNDELVGKCDNMFTKYRFSVTKHIKDGVNKLSVKLVSPVKEGKYLASRLPHVIPIECWPPAYNGECHINQLRKMQASFGWDWGPAFPSMGIWKGVVLETCQEPLLYSVGTFVEDHNAVWLVTVKAWFEPCSKDDSLTGHLITRLTVDNSSIISQKKVTLYEANDFFEARTHFTVPKDEVELWWPNGYGEQALYPLDVVFNGGKTFQVKFINMAFRQIELIQVPIVPSDLSKGLTFFFKVNGVEIFAKGSNWIPTDILPEKSANMTRVKYLLKSASKAHFNMLRVWGGGIYETDYFYKECDRLGIMIWQDLMFACNMYPAEDYFLSSVYKEVSQQVARLQHHPSIILWAGNNENEAALRQNWYGTRSNFTLFQKEYIKLYVDTIKTAVVSLDSSRPYLESSPSNGIETEKENYIAQDPQSSYYGDVHYYNYLSNMWQSYIYPKARFVSEYGVQSLPSMATLAQAASPDDLVIGSEWLTARQHQAGGFAYMNTQIEYNLPKAEDLPQLVYFSQINQAMSIQVETETYRKQRNKIYSTGEGRTMGALYWQLNDVWQAPSWSSIDSSGRWKMLHYYALKFFSPLAIIPSMTVDDRVAVSLVSDLLKPKSVMLSTYVMSTQHFVPLKIIRQNLSLVANSAMEAYTEDVAIVTKQCQNKTQCFLMFTLDDITFKSPRSLAPVSYLFIEKIKNMSFPKAKITVKDCKRSSSHQVKFLLETNAVAFFVWLETEIDGTFSDNGFHMTEPTKEVWFDSMKPFQISLEQFLNSLSIVDVNSAFK